MEKQSNIQIKDSWRFSKHEFGNILLQLEQQNPDSPVWDRTFMSLAREWATHNLLYSLGICRSHTKDVDLNYPQPWYVRLGYTVFGTFALWVIR